MISWRSLLCRLHIAFSIHREGLASFPGDRKSTRLNSSHSQISYAVFCLKKKHVHAVVADEARDEHVGGLPVHLGGRPPRCQPPPAKGCPAPSPPPSRRPPPRRLPRRCRV